MVNRDFYFGFFCCFILNNIQQDAMGKEMYIKKVTEYWMDTSVWLWVAIWFAGFSMWIYTTYKYEIKHK